MNSYLKLTFHLSLVLTFIGYFFNFRPLVSTGYGLVMPILFLLYGFTRNWKFSNIDIIIYLMCFGGFLSDVFTYANFGDLGITIQISLSLLNNIIIYYLIRLEGKLIIYSDKSDLWKFLIPIIPSAFFSIVITSSTLNKEYVYFSGVFYSIFTYLFILNALYLDTNQTYKKLALASVLFRVLSDIFYACVVFLNIENILMSYASFFFYAYSQFLIVLSILITQNKHISNSDENYLIIPSYIKKFL
ncbi:hypothetical protein Emtol_3242 [Emticicia oligotrophica DSM 17448]|uniref:YhhN-like protein n=1 Tax=Emticicia oligotrophica (strain DSM 17448 / CIP 109782 / MTCC 6937 / GPTSA100-15) TaxID=929562 RepID=A0ABN4AQ61_EMTOG|nr:hypothetical protein [Emticicia oligotrophica]AFK04371.1 hypothetical protein Emtol_3242 [Emticicia oligotrophica DSM 17448]